MHGVDSQEIQFAEKRRGELHPLPDQNSRSQTSRIMPNPERLTPKDLEVGGQYLHVNRLFIRQIDAIDSDTVTYHDQHGHGRCGRRAFLKGCPSRASAEDAAQSEERLMHISRTTEQDEFTPRDEANALTAFAYLRQTYGDPRMNHIGPGYGSEWHLLRFLE